MPSFLRPFLALLKRTKNESLLAGQIPPQVTNLVNFGQNRQKVPERVQNLTGRISLDPCRVQGRAGGWGFGRGQDLLPLALPPPRTD